MIEGSCHCGAVGIELAEAPKELDPALLEGLRIRKFDGAATWEFLD